MTSTYRRRVALGALAVTALATAAVPYVSAPRQAAGPATPRQAAEPITPRQAAEPAVPATFGLDTHPDELLPETIDAAAPVAVLTTTRDAAGRPVVTRSVATDRASAAAAVRAGQQAPNAVGVELDAPVTASGVDTYRSLQWDFEKLAIADTWELSTGAGITVAVIDSGIDATNPDLAANVVPGIDLVDTGDGRTDPNGHGTHVAGTIAAVAGNDEGIAGIAPDAKVMPIRTLNAEGTGWNSDVATGLVYAADHGADVVNMSLGSKWQSYAVTQAVAYARSKGVVVVAAAGNQRADGSPRTYPGADPGVIAVASTTSTDTYSSFSNQGDYVDVAAPGSSILSTRPVAKGSYAYLSGTSMAAPHVAALAALLKAHAPQLTPDEVEEVIEGTALDLGTPGYDTDYGNGRIRPLAALQQATATPSPTTTASPTATPSPTTTPENTGTPQTSAPATSPPVTDPPATSPDPTATPTEPAMSQPVVTSDATSRTVAHGAAVGTTFTVAVGGVPWTGRKAALCEAPANGEFHCTQRFTSSAGTVQHTRTATAGFRIRLYVYAGPTSASAISDTVVYTVRASAGLERAGSRSLSARVRGDSGQVARLQRLDGARWTTVASYRVTPTRTLAGLKPGARYRLSITGTAKVSGAESAVVRL